MKTVVVWLDNGRTINLTMAPVEAGPFMSALREAMRGQSTVFDDFSGSQVLIIRPDRVVALTCHDVRGRRDGGAE